MTDLIPLGAQIMGCWVMGYVLGYALKYFTRLIESV